MEMSLMNAPPSQLEWMLPELKKMFANPEASDVVFMVEKKSVLGNKRVLATQTEYFARLPFVIFLFYQDVQLFVQRGTE